MTKDYIKEYGSGVRKFQMGGPMPEPTEAPQAAPGPPASPEQGAPDIEQMIMQVYETQDPQLALQVINIIAEQSGMASGGAPAPGQEPVMARKGTKIPVIPSTLIA